MKLMNKAATLPFKNLFWSLNETPLEEMNSARHFGLEQLNGRRFRIRVFFISPIAYDDVHDENDTSLKKQHEII